MLGRGLLTAIVTGLLWASVGQAQIATLGTPQVADNEPAATGEKALIPSEKSADTATNKPRVEVIGAIQAEAAVASQSTRNQQIIGTVNDAVGFRRARLGARGDIGEQVHWIGLFDFASGSIAFRDVFVAVDKLPWLGEVRVGNFREPFSLEGQTSSSDMPFVERSPAVVLDPAYHWGVGLFNYTESERATVQAGIFRSGSGSNGAVFSDSNDLQYTARLTGLLWKGGTADAPTLVHVGGAFSQQCALDNIIKYNQGPQSSLLPLTENPASPFVPIITLNANQQQLYNVQTALAIGSLSVQAEWNAAVIQQLQGGPVVFQGGYAYASFFLTGEHRDYDGKTGTFNGVHVDRPFLCMRGDKQVGGGWGAWELAVRFSYMKYRNSHLPLASSGLLQGDNEADGVVGINWYLNDNARIMVNWTHAVIVDPNFGPSFADAIFVSCQVSW